MSHQTNPYGAAPPPHPPPGPHQFEYAQPSRKRSRPREDLQLDLQGLTGLGPVADVNSGDLPVELTPHGHHSQPQQLHYQPSGALPTPQHHHHRLPNQPPPKRLRMGGYGETSPPAQQSHGPPSVVGQEGMPPPAPRPRGPKLKFTPEDDQLLVDLKEKKNLTWKQIADFFPGRSSGTLQVRYCTKLKAKTTNWTDESVQKLRNAMTEYENDRWRIISTKVGGGFTPQACREKAAELDAQGDQEAEGDPEGGEEGESSFEQGEMEATASEEQIGFR